MSASLPSDEVAADFRDSLQDLQINNRYEISNLTIIAKENAEHAPALSRVLQHHIKTTAPSRKLPALYVLDSIVKNVGSPYTLYLGQNLYQIFMDAYVLVDPTTRKSMEAMLKTWKEPVPGSMDPAPVFKPDFTKPIENALIRARTAAIQQQQSARAQNPPIPLPPRPSSATYRDSPTQQHGISRYAQPPVPQRHAPQYGYPNQMPTPQQPSAQQYEQSMHTLSPSVREPQPIPHAAYDINRLNDDIARLIEAVKLQFASNVFDSSLQMKLQALLDLQNILRSQQLPQEALGQIKVQIDQLSASLPQAPPSVTLLPTTPQSDPRPSAQLRWQPPTPSYQPPQPYPAPPQSVPSYQPPPSVQTPPSQPVFPSDMLARLLASTSNGPNPNTPTLRAATPALQGLQALNGFAPPQHAATPPASTPAPASHDLFAALRASGMLPPAPPASAQPAQVPQPPRPLLLPPELQSLLLGQPAKVGTPPITAAQLAFAAPQINVPLTAASLKTPRPELVSGLYDSQPNQCTSCGRRFLATEEGRKRKARHLDWHFRISTSADAHNLGQSRLWYQDDREWIYYTDVDESAEPPSDDTIAAAKQAKKGPKDQYIPIPADATPATSACPICQEKFENKWHELAQEWVWMDAIKVGGRVYHASCHEEVLNAHREECRRSMTPESALGKRKAEEDLLNTRDKLKRETAI
ncbi:mRNA 3' end processing factor [Elasticomyces elasticus]|nr:mRNA 3' end processing factor [Elasticomyces elasticus]